MKFTRIKWHWIGIPVLTVAMLLIGDTSEAKSQGFSLQVGRLGISTYGGYGNGFGGYNSYRSYRPSYHYGAPIYRSNYGTRYRSNYRSYHSARPHYDYHPPVIVPHGNHFDYVPGRYQLHYGRHHRH